MTQVTKLGIVSCRVTQAYSPVHAVRLRPREHTHKISFQMNDRPLSSCILKRRMIAHVYHVEHHGARTKVERNIVADGRPWKHFNGRCKPVLLKTGNSYCGPGFCVP